MRGDRALAAAAFLTVLVAVAPAPTGWDVYALRFAALLISLCAWVLAGFLGGLRRPERTDLPLLGAGLLLAVLVLVSTALSYAPAELLTFGAGYYLGASSWLAILAIGACAILARPTAALRRALRFAQVPLAVVALIAIGQVVAGDPRVIAGFENSNHLVPGMLLGGSMAFGLAQGASAAPRAASLATAGLTWLACLLSGSQAGAGGAIVSIAAAGLLCPGVFGARAAQRQKMVRIATVIAAVILLTAAVAAGASRSAGNDPLESLFGSSLSARASYWRWAAHVGTASLFGAGADGFEQSAQKLVRLDDAAVLSQGAVVETAPVAGDPHSLPMLVLASFGIPGLLVACALVALYAVSAAAVLRRRQGRSLRAAWIAGALGWAAAMCLLPFSVQWAGLPAMLLGLPLMRETESADAPSAPAVRVVASAVGLVGMAASLILAASTVTGAYWYAEADRAVTDAEALASMRRAAAAQPTMGFYRFIVLDIEGKRAMESGEGIDTFHEDVDAAGPAIAEEPRYMALLVRRSLDEAYLTGRSDLSWERRVLERLSAEAPGWLEVPMERAHLELLDGNPAEAEVQLTSVLPYATHLKRFGLYRLYFARAVGRADLAAQALTTAVVDEETALLSKDPAVPRW